MSERLDFFSNQQAVLDYYRASEKGYWEYLRGRCHYGYSSEYHRGPFNMEAAQLEMERKLGQTLDLPSGSKILDAGCGYGPVARTLTNEFKYDVVGIDFIDRRLHKGQEISRDADTPLNLTNADYHFLPFADNSFDGIYTMETLVHAFDHKKVLNEFLRVLKPGGKLVLFEYSIPKLTSVPPIARKLAERVIRNTGMASLPEFYHGAFPKILTDSGFDNAKAEDISKNVYPSWFYLWKFAVKSTLEEWQHGNIGIDQIPGSMWIWPARHKLGYNICQATKPRQELPING